MPCPVSFKKPGIFCGKPASRVRRETLSPGIYPSETTGKTNRSPSSSFLPSRFLPLRLIMGGTINTHSSTREQSRAYKTIAVQEKREIFTMEQGYSSAQRNTENPAARLYLGTACKTQAPFPSASGPLISSFAGFSYPVIGVQDALAQTDKMRCSLHQFIRFNVFNGTLQGKNDGRGELDAVSLRG